jgi:hypothetical protein
MSSSGAAPLVCGPGGTLTNFGAETAFAFRSSIETSAFEPRGLLANIAYLPCALLGALA